MELPEVELHDITDRDYPHIRTEPEKSMLVGMLDWVREGVMLKSGGLTDQQASRRLVASDSTIVGIIKHLAFAEDIWFTERFANEGFPEPFGSAPFDEDPDWEFHSASDDGLEACLALYVASCARSRSITERFDLDDLGDHGRMPFTLRFALNHMVTETARHLGHIDILREQLDGGVGG